MFKDSESPISLFSFQDIITSLTGIMIFFLLVLAISLFETKETSTNPYREELRSSRKTLALLKRQIKDYQDDAKSYRRRLQESFQVDTASLQIELWNLQEKNKALRQNLDREKMRIREQQQQQEKLAAESRKNTADEEKLHELSEHDVKQQKRIVMLKEQNRQLESEILRRRKTIAVTIDGNTNKKPLIIECSGEKIRIGDGAYMEPASITRTTPEAASMVEMAVTRLSSYQQQQFYFVFIFKPSSARYAHYFLTRVHDSFPKAEYGCEPILESEVCF